MLLLLVMVMVVLGTLKVNSLILSLKLVNLFINEGAKAERLVIAEAKSNAIELAKDRVERLVSTQETVWTTDVCPVTGGSARYKVVSKNGVNCIVRNILNGDMFSVNVLDLVNSVR